MTVLQFARYRHHSATATVDGLGRGTSEGQSAEGQLSENHRIARSMRRTWMSAPPSIALSFLPSSKARELTVESSISSIAAYARATVKSCSMPFMDAVSVILPHKSTAILPDAPSVNFGHSTEMNLAAILERIEQRLEALHLSDHKASELSGHRDAIRNIRRALKNGRKGFNTGTLGDLARALEVKPAWLMGDEDTEPAPPAEGGDLDTLRAKRLQLMSQLQHLEYSISVLEQAHSTQQKRKSAKSR